MQPRRGLQPRDGKRGRAAVLALDVISDFVFPDGPRVRRALQARAAGDSPVAGARAIASHPVIYANDNVGPWRSDSAALIARCVEPARAGAQLVRSLLPAERDSIILKPRHSAFFGTPLVALLDDLDADTLILLGVSAESCVWMTAAMRIRGLGLVVPVDTMAGVSAVALRTTAKSLRRCWARACQEAPPRCASPPAGFSLNAARVCINPIALCLRGSESCPRVARADGVRTAAAPGRRHQPIPTGAGNSARVRACAPASVATSFASAVGRGFPVPRQKAPARRLPLRKS
jgi:nicotinamidase-related amidase